MQRLSPCFQRPSALISRLYSNPLALADTILPISNSVYLNSRRWATKKSGGSTKNGRDSMSKRLGVKIFGSQAVNAGNIIIRQRGTKYHPGTGVGIGKDHTIYAKRDGFVRFWYDVPKKRQQVSVKSTRHRIPHIPKQVVELQK